MSLQNFISYYQLTHHSWASLWWQCHSVRIRVRSSWMVLLL